MKTYRQGDVLLVKVDTIPTNTSKKDKIIAYGEITGHSHRFNQKSAVIVLETPEKEQFVKIQSKAALEHEDHANIMIPPGQYKVIIQREFDIIEGIRQVLD